AIAKVPRHRMSDLDQTVKRPQLVVRPQATSESGSRRYRCYGGALRSRGAFFARHDNLLFTNRTHSRAELNANNGDLTLSIEVICRPSRRALDYPPLPH